jgi:hypothetical protein
MIDLEIKENEDEKLSENRGLRTLRPLVPVLFLLVRSQMLGRIILLVLRRELML